MIPELTKNAIDRYVNNRTSPGGFVTAVLENDLMEAYARADSGNINAMYDIVKYVYNEIPMACWGSSKKVYDWLNSKEVE